MFCNMQIKYILTCSSCTVAKKNKKQNPSWVGFTFGFDCIFEASGQLKDKHQ